jgi:large repetitive protein
VFQSLRRVLAPAVLLCVVWPAVAAAPTPLVVLDINANGGPASSSPHSAIAAGSGAFFVASDAAHGPELWHTDGTLAGTQLVSDILPGPASSNPTPLLVLNGKLLLVADDGTHGAELWTSDGTAAGTSLVLDIKPGSAGSIANVGVTATMGGLMYFFANDGTAGVELWKTDGTASGTVMVADVNPAGDGAFPTLAVSASTLYFVGNDGTNGTELWKTDGTGAGTAMVADVGAGPSNGVSVNSTVVAAGNYVLFNANDGTHGLEPFVTQGTSATTQLLIDANPGANSGNMTFAIAVGARALFNASDGSGLSHIFVTDGTPAGTASTGEFSTIGGYVLVGSTCVFTATDTTYGPELWSSDGTVGGTALLKDIYPGTTGGSPAALVSNGTRAWFGAADTSGVALWTSDGTAAGTVSLGVGLTSGFVVTPGGLWFVASDAMHGSELWHSDGTMPGTALAGEVVVGAGGSSPSPLAAFGAKLLFTANDGAHGVEPYVSDGTAAGTLSLGDLDPATVTGSSNPSEFLVNNGLTYFVANPGTGNQLFVTDGTAAGTFSPTAGKGLGFAIAAPPNILNGTPREPSLVAFGDGVAFVAGTDLWVSDGTAAGTLPVTFGSGATVAAGAVLGVIEPFIYFAASDPAHGSELWTSDGTPGGSFMVADLYAGSTSSNPIRGAVLGNTLTFFAHTSTTTAGMSLWATDGTATATVLLRTFLATGSGAVVASTHIGHGVVSGGQALYPLEGPGGEFRIVATDGTAGNFLNTGGIAAVAVLASSSPFQLLPFAGGILFSCNLSGYEPCFYSSGTKPALLKDIAVGLAASSHPADFVVAGEYAYFAASGPNGNEVYATDGTPAGTRLAADVRPGASSSNPALLGAFGTSVLFVADDGTGAGKQLWRLAAPSRPFVPLARVSVATSGGTGLPPVFELPFDLEHTFFPASDGVHGTELWSTDGTPQGTHEIADQTPGPGSSSPSNLFLIGDRLFFTATDPYLGRELFGIALDGTPPEIVPTVTGTATDAGFYTSDVTVTWSVSDPDSPVTAEVGCGPFTLTADTPGTSVTCTATSAGGAAMASVTLKRDTQRPILVCPEPLNAEATSASGATVMYPGPAAQDAIDPAPSLTEDHASGSAFPMGVTVVTATATDAAGNSSQCTFDVTVRDTTAPALTCPAAMSVAATSADGAAVTFAPTATDVVDSAPVVTADPASGTTFTVGSTLVNVSAKDAAGNTARCAFLVTVRDPNAPMLTCPPNQTAMATDGSGATVSYPGPTVQDPVDPMPRITASHASGDTFPVGKTTVEVTATNAAGHASSCEFVVTVTGGVTTTPSHCGCTTGMPGLALLALFVTLRRRSRSSVR